VRFFTDRVSHLPYAGLTMSPPNLCQSCTDLWREYAEATRAHADLLQEHERAGRRATAALKQLDPLLELAAVRRDSARVEIRVHLATDHGCEPASRTATA
jgi:hypothetical protein